MQEIWCMFCVILPSAKVLYLCQYWLFFTFCLWNTQLLLLTNNTAVAGVDTNFFLAAQIFGHTKNGRSRPKCTSDGDSTRNIALCFLPTQRAHHVESTWIRRGYYVDTSKTKFLRISTSFPRTFSMWFYGRKIHVDSTYFFRCNFAGRKIHVDSTYFFRCNFGGWKFHVDSTHFFRCNFDGRKMHIVSTYFLRCNFDGRNMQVVFTYFFRRNFDGQGFDIVFGKL